MNINLMDFKKLKMVVIGNIKNNKYLLHYQLNN